MSALSFRNVWVEYGSQIVLERINIEITSGTFLSVVGPSGARQEHLPAPDPRPGTAVAGAVLLDGEPFPAEPGPDRGIVFQRYSVFPHLTVLGNVLVGYEFEQRPLTARLFGAARRAGDRKKRSDDRERRARGASRQISERAVRWHAAAACDRAGAGAPAARSCCSTSRSARSIPAPARRCTP